MPVAETIWRVFGVATSPTHGEPSIGRTLAQGARMITGKADSTLVYSSHHLFIFDYTNSCESIQRRTLQFY